MNGCGTGFTGTSMDGLGCSNVEDPKSKEWKEAAETSEFERVDRKLVDFGGLQQIGLFKVDGDYFAISAYCTHQQVPMVHGYLDGHELMCPLHGARYDIRSGEALALPAMGPIRTFNVKVEDRKILIEV